MVEAVAREAGVQTAVLNPIEWLTESEQTGGADPTAGATTKDAGSEPQLSLLEGG